MLEEYEKSHATEEDEVKREDRLALAALDAVMREFAAELRRNAPPAPAGTPRHPREQFGVVASGPKADEVGLCFTIIILEIRPSIATVSLCFYALNGFRIAGC